STGEGDPDLARLLRRLPRGNQRQLARRQILHGRRRLHERGHPLARAGSDEGELLRRRRLRGRWLEDGRSRRLGKEESGEAGFSSVQISIFIIFC
ncbi:unnamed protein product, partial [Linum tenue]